MTQTRTYASGFVGRIAALVAGLVAVPIAAYAIPLLLGEALDIHDNRILIGACVGILSVGGVWVLLHVFVTGPVRFETDARYVRLHRGGRVRHEWDRGGAWFVSFVERQTMNGVPTGATRKVFATTAGERVEVLCRWFTAATFSDLMADLAPVTHRDEPTARPTARSFELDPAASGLRGRGRSVVILLALGVLVTLGVAAWFVVTADTVDETALVSLGVGALIVLFLVGLAFVSAHRRASRVPARIGLTGSTIQVDQTVHHFAQLRSISLTPPSYSLNSRSMLLVGSTGERTAVSLGSGYGMKTTFPEYDAFVETLGRLAPTGLVRFDLK